jgi:tRNA nucleotidyltransferase/poly(A) polymerase
MSSANPHVRLREQALQVLKVLEEAGFQARFAGGCVRDKLLGLVPKDYDIASTSLPDQTMKTFADAGYKVVPTGIDHGTITVVTKEGPVEITTLRKDVNTDGRHATVEFGGASFEEDAARRDFTMNALFEDLRGEISDFHNGREHIKRSIIDFVGAADARIQEDYLRTLRFFRFWARFELVPAEGCLNAIKSNLDGLAGISQERITSELFGLLTADKPQIALTSMVDSGVLKAVVPEIISTGRSHDNLHKLKERWRFSARFALMILESNMSGVDIDPLGVRLRLPIEEIKRTKAAVDGIEKLKNVNGEATMAMDLVDYLEQQAGKAVFTDSFLFLWKTWFSLKDLKELQTALSFVDKVEQTKGHIRRTKIPVNGHDVMKHLNIPASEELGKILGKLKNAFRNEVWKTRVEGFAWIDKNIKN